MEPEISVMITLAFLDSSKRTYTFSGVAPEEGGEISDRVKAINANMSEAFKQTFVSNDGAPCVMIAAAKMVMVEEEVIYSAG